MANKILMTLFVVSLLGLNSIPSVAVAGIAATSNACFPGEEICDGRDNNCNNVVDDVVGVGGYCEVEIGVCAFMGKFICDPAIDSRPICVPDVGPSVEVCNGRDDDCDGQRDEELAQQCSNVCGQGSQTCSDGVWGACSVRQPINEICNGIDDDCDGLVDNGVSCGVISQSDILPRPTEEPLEETPVETPAEVKPEATIPQIPKAASNIFDLAKTRALYLPCNVTDFRIVDGVFVGTCDKWLVTINMEQFAKWFTGDIGEDGGPKFDIVSNGDVDRDVPDVPKDEVLKIKAGGRELDFDADMSRALFGEKFDNVLGSGNFEGIDKINILVGGLYSIRNGFIETALGGEGVSKAVGAGEVSVNAYPESEESYPGCSGLDKICNTETNFLVSPSNFASSDIKGYGGPDLMVMYKMVGEDDLAKLRDGKEFDSLAALFIFPNANEAPVIEDVAQNTDTVAAVARDPSGDTLKWSCAYSSGGDCSGMLASLEGNTTSIAVAPLSIGMGMGKAFSSTAGQNTVILKACDAGGLCDSRELQINVETGAGKAVIGPLMAMEQWSIGGGGCGGLFSIGTGGGDVNVDMKQVLVALILMLGVLIPIAVLRLRSARAN